jgi:hypothetical protein
LTLVTFKFITTGLDVLFIPFLSNMLAMIIAIVCIAIKKCYKPESDREKLLGYELAKNYSRDLINI